MPDDPRTDLSRYRLSKAEECCTAARKLLSEDLLADSVNRSYYAIFHAIRVLLALEGKDFKKHSAVIAYFQKQYVKTGVFDKVYSNIARDAFNIRQDSDYEDFFLISVEDASKQLKNAERFIEAIKAYLQTK